MSDAAPADTGRFVARLGGEVCRRPVRVVLACLATVLGSAVVAQADVSGGSDAPAAQIGTPARTAVTELPLPGDLSSWRAGARSAAATCPGLPPEVLVAIAQVESRLGHLPGPSSAGARGPMQFLPSMWAAFGIDGDGDGRADVLNSVDALHGAARFLCAHGGGDPEHLRSALWSYNHSDHYVRQVLSLAWVNRSAA